jgi:hypothetical protein
MTAQNLSQKSSVSNNSQDYPNYRWVVMLLDKVIDPEPNSIYSDINQRKLKFNNAAVFMVILPAKTKWRGYTKHKTMAGAIKKTAFYDRENQYYEIIDCMGNYYKKTTGSNGKELLVQIPNKTLKHTVKQEIPNTKNP